MEIQNKKQNKPLKKRQLGSDRLAPSAPELSGLRNVHSALRAPGSPDPQTEARVRLPLLLSPASGSLLPAFTDSQGLSREGLKAIYRAVSTSLQNLNPQPLASYINFQARETCFRRQPGVRSHGPCETQ